VRQAGGARLRAWWKPPEEAARAGRSSGRRRAAPWPGDWLSAPTMRSGRLAVWVHETVDRHVGQTPRLCRIGEIGTDPSGVRAEGLELHRCFTVEIRRT
jgi:hypothetical protein